jgi:NAD(P)-dependent dehydrogenase (short-subunit alcohol dehydrogenase family)
MSKVVLITGCSTGIGRDLAQRLGQPDYNYVAGFPFSGRLVLHLGGSVWDLVVRQMFKIAPTP